MPGVQSEDPSQASQRLLESRLYMLPYWLWIANRSAYQNRGRTTTSDKLLNVCLA